MYRFLIVLLGLLLSGNLAAKDLPVCVPIGFRAYIPAMDFDPDRLLDGDWYRQIPLSTFRKALKSHLDGMGFFEEVSLDSTAPYDVVLRLELLDLRRVPISSDRDLGVRLSLSLEDPVIGQAIWAGSDPSSMRATMNEILGFFTKYHHRNGPCSHMAFDRASRGIE